MLWLHIKFILLVSGGCFLAWIAYRMARYDCFLNCDEDETEANAMTPGKFNEESRN